LLVDNSAFKGLAPFQEPLLEVLAYSQEQMRSWADAGPKNSWALKLDRHQTLRRLQQSKERVYQSLNCSCAALYGDRQEFRVLLETLEAMLEDTGRCGQQATLQPENDVLAAAHYSFWFLSTDEVNSFWIAESNRWLLALETAARMANHAPTGGNITTVTEQEHNSLLSTASARLLRFSLSCLNPQEYPSLWEEEYVGEEGLGVKIFEIAYSKRKSRSNHFPTWQSGLWANRVAPLFRPSAEQPVWGRTAPHSLKVDEIHAMIQEQAESSEYASRMAAAFDERIKSTTGFYVQAILHYEHDKRSTLAKVSALNATTTRERRRALSDLERTKWMFPAFAPNGVSRHRLSVGKARALSRTWETLNESDVHTEFSYPPKRLVRGTYTFSEHSGRLDTLEEFYAEQRAWTETQQARMRGLDPGEETDWPERPTRGARTTANDSDVND
ncbi:hypothetical protein E8E12_000053, partial [Didymella heteroderae]